jgi:hypothetical protein
MGDQWIRGIENLDLADGKAIAVTKAKIRTESLT